jgi:molecular chaperone GrpE
MSNAAQQDAHKEVESTDTEMEELHGDPEATVVLQDTPGTRSALSDLEQRLAAAEARAEEARNNQLRAAAELDNVRKRTQRDIENAHKYGLERFAQELLPVKDSLELGLEAAQKSDEYADAASLIAGKQATLQLLSRAFEKFNLTEVNPVGAPFDPTLHEAVMMQESATAEPNSVLQVVQKGYQLNGRLLRPARVIVAKAPGT